MAAALQIGIAGAGLLGRLLAWRLSGLGHRVTVFDPASGPLDRAAPTRAAGWTAAGMLSPWAELESADAHMAELGVRSLSLWAEIVDELRPAVYFRREGSLLLAHRSDLGSAQRLLDLLKSRMPDGNAPRALTAGELSALEPSVHGPTHAWLLEGEGQIHTVQAMAALAEGAARRGVRWRWGQAVQHLAPGRIDRERFDTVFDVRGVGARPHVGVCGDGMDGPPQTSTSDLGFRARSRDDDLGFAPQVSGNDLGSMPQLRGDDLGFTPQLRGDDFEFTPQSRSDDFGFTPQSRGEDLGFTPRIRGEDLGFTPRIRGVRGEILWLHAPGVVLNRPLRLLHPRSRVYLVPRPDDIVVVGASEIESEDRSPISVRTLLGLLSAAHSVIPELAEARVVHTETNLRPALPDNLPHVEHRPGLVRINGLFRHGWLIAPALVDDALREAGLAGAAVPDAARELVA